MSLEPEDSIKRLCEHAQNPLHDSRQTLILPGLNEKVYVITHDTEISDRESVFFLRSLHDTKKKPLDLICPKNKLTSICASNDVILCAGDDKSRSPHARYDYRFCDDASRSGVVLRISFLPPSPRNGP